MKENFQFSAAAVCTGLFSYPAGHFCPPPPPLRPLQSALLYEWRTVSWAPVTYENQAILFCFAATLHGSSHSTGYRRKRTTMFVASGVCIPGMFLYVGTVYHAVQATV